MTPLTTYRTGDMPRRAPSENWALLFGLAVCAACWVALAQLMLGGR